METFIRAVPSGGTSYQETGTKVHPVHCATSARLQQLLPRRHQDFEDRGLPFEGHQSRLAFALASYVRSLLSTKSNFAKKPMLLTDQWLHNITKETLSATGISHLQFAVSSNTNLSSLPGAVEPRRRSSTPHAVPVENLNTSQPPTKIQITSATRYPFAKREKSHPSCRVNARERFQN